MNFVFNLLMGLRGKLFKVSEWFWLKFEYVSKILGLYRDQFLSFLIVIMGNFGANQIQIFANAIDFLIETDWQKKRYWPINIVKVFFALLLVSVLALLLILFIMTMGSFAALFGFRNLAQYSLKEQFIAWLPIVAIIFTLPLYCGEYALYRIGLIAAFSIALIGQDFLLGQCRIVSLGHAGFLLMSGFLTTWLINGDFGFEVPALFAIVLGSLLNGLLGLLLGLPALRVKDDYLVIVSLALTLSIPLFLQSKYLSKLSHVTEGGIPLRKIYIPEVFSWLQPYVFRYFLVICPSVILVFIAYNLLHHSQLRRGWQTIKCEREVSTILGVPTIKYKLLAFVMSAIYAGFGGGLLVILTQFISKDSYTINTSLDFLIAGVVCGLGGILGSVVGGAFLAIIPDITDYAAQHINGGAYLAQSSYGLILILTSFFMPKGLTNEITNWLKNKFVSPIPREGFQMSPPSDHDYINNRKNHFTGTK